MKGHYIGIYHSELASSDSPSSLVSPLRNKLPVGSEPKLSLGDDRVHYVGQVFVHWHAHCVIREERHVPVLLLTSGRLKNGRVTCWKTMKNSGKSQAKRRYSVLRAVIITNMACRPAGFWDAAGIHRPHGHLTANHIAYRGSWKEGGEIYPGICFGLLSVSMIESMTEQMPLCTKRNPNPAKIQHCTFGVRDRDF